MKTYHTLVILITGNTMVAAKSMDDIIKHFRGGLPVNMAVKTIYSLDPVTYAQAEAFVDLPQFDDIESFINLV
jgi:hypothetical protein